MSDKGPGPSRGSLLGDWRAGLGIEPGRAGMMVCVGLAIGVVGVGVNSAMSDGDLRVGPLPWTMAGAMACLAYCSLGVVSFHRATPNVPLSLGGWWTALAFLGIGAFFLALAIGGVLGIEEEEAGAATIPPLLGIMFGVVSMAPANLVLAFGVHRASLLPGAVQAAFWASAFSLPALLIIGGLSEGTIETITSAAVVGAFALSWLRIGLWIARTAQPSVSQI